MSIPTPYRCQLCGLPVRTNEPDVYRSVAGWVQQRKEGGVHTLVFREETGLWAHNKCMTLAKAGRTRDQLELFGEEPA